jgi:hypothetical protein
MTDKQQETVVIIIIIISSRQHGIELLPPQVVVADAVQLPVMTDNKHQTARGVREAHFTH